jgi:L-asparaginase
MTPLLTPRVHVVATGGTFDKVYDPSRERLDLIAPSSIPKILAACGVAHVDFHPLMQIDSQTMDDAVRGRILDYARGLEGGRVVIVHGTSSLTETARYFQRAGVAGTYVFTGAMVPFAYSPIEASFNLGGAIALAATLPDGVHVHMHGEIFDPREAEKDVPAARIVRTAPLRD